MSITSLTILVLLVGVIAYLLLNVLVQPVRVGAACLLMVGIAAFVIHNREILALRGIIADGQVFSIFSEKRIPSVPHPINDPGPGADVTFQDIIKEDHEFLDEIVQKQNQNDPPRDTPASAPIQEIRKEGIVVVHKETVKRAQLITRNESVKRAELVRSTQR